MRNNRTNLFKRRVNGRVIAGTIFFAMIFSGAPMAQTNQSGSIKTEIAELMTCYAYGSDALAKAVGADAGPEEGLAIYEECLADDWTMTLVGADGPIAGPFDREVWANNIVYPTFLEGGVVDGQHMIGSVQIETRGDRGTMKAYAIVNLVDDTDVRTQIITYVSEVERRPNRVYWPVAGPLPERWVITGTTLETTAESASPKR